MSTDLTLFTHPVFGNLRTIVDGETIYICAKDAATALGYSNTNKAIKDHCEWGNENGTPSPTAWDVSRRLSSSPKATCIS